MNKEKLHTDWISVFLAALLLGSFFIPWVSWHGARMAGYSLPVGDFFATSAEKFNLDNPFPELNFSFYVFWLVPVAAIATAIQAIRGRNTSWLALVAGVLALSQAAVYVLFTNTLLQLGVGKSLLSSLVFGIWLTVFAAIGLILAGTRFKTWLKPALVIAGPLVVWISFMVIEKKLMNEEYGDSTREKSAYTVSGADLIREFKDNDSLANAKYREKILTVMGRISETEMPNDSTVNIRMADSTGSYISFSLEGKYLEPARQLKSGDSVIVKGSCSGGVYSDILETYTIHFKRNALIKQ